MGEEEGGGAASARGAGRRRRGNFRKRRHDDGNDDGGVDLGAGEEALRKVSRTQTGATATAATAGTGGNADAPVRELRYGSTASQVAGNVDAADDATRGTETVPAGPNKGVGGKYGPMRATGAIRTTFRMDYQPDVCKDYKETGYCGYGDACVFLHDRSDYKSGWQLEKEWEEKQREKERERMAIKTMMGEDGGADDGKAKEAEDAAALPHSCHVCRKGWTPKATPVRTKCGHWFCEACVLKSKYCAVCKKSTNGIFSYAKGETLAKLMERGRSVVTCIPIEG